MTRLSKSTETAKHAPIGSKSSAAFARGRQVFPGGTTRVTVERDPFPRYISHGEGAYLVDLDGRRFLDLGANFTTLIHGHAFAPVVEAVRRQMEIGTCFAHPTEVEIALADLLCDRIPRLDKLRFVSTGTEAVMFAIKAARAFTRRSAVAKFEGAYHGAYDWAEVSQSAVPDNWGPAEEPTAVPYYEGTPQSVLDETLILRFNDAEGTARLIAEHADRLAAVIVDPMPSRAGLVAPKPTFIAALQNVCRSHNVVLISDEVLNLRQGYHGASPRYGLEPDLITLGKIIGGGLPIGAVGGREDIMAVFDAEAGGPSVPQGGTFSANPISLVAGLASMEALDHTAFEQLDALGERLRARLRAAIASHDASFSVTGATSLFRLHPSRKAPESYRDAYLAPEGRSVMQAMTRHFADHGILFPKAGVCCLSIPMRAEDVDLVADAFADFLAGHPYAQSAQ